MAKITFQSLRGKAYENIAKASPSFTQEAFRAEMVKLGWHYAEKKAKAKDVKELVKAINVAVKPENKKLIVTK